VGVLVRSAAVGNPRRIPSDAVVVRQGDSIESLFLLTSGAIRLSSVTLEGREIVVGLLGPGEVFGECALLGRPSPVEARAVGETEILGLPMSHLRDLLRRQPATAEELLRLVAARLHRTGRALEDSLTGAVRARLSGRLRDLAETHGARTPEGVRIRIPLTRQELARMVGSTRESVSRTMGGLEGRGLVRTEGRSVVIPDPAALRAAAP
jgi:CRP/FNR family transcriptional regulator